MKFKPLLIALAAASTSHAAIVQYTDRSAFLTAINAATESTDFSNLPAGTLGTKSVSVFNSTLLIETRDSTNSFAGDDFWVSNLGNLDHALGASATYSDQLRITSGGLYVIGADWFLGNFDDDYQAGTVTLTFSDGSIFNVTSTSQADSFRGFISDTLITSVLITPSDPTNIAAWATIDNLVIPEPSTTLLGAVTALALVTRRKRSA